MAMPEDSSAEEPQASSLSKLHRNHAPYTARIKKMMQADEDVGKVAKATPILISKALDEFLQVMMEGAAKVAVEHGARTLTASHLKAHIVSSPLLDFCMETVKDVPDLAPQENTVGRTSRKRIKSGGDETAGEPTPARKPRKKAEPREDAQLASASDTGACVKEEPEPAEDDGDGGAPPANGESAAAVATGAMEAVLRDDGQPAPAEIPSIESPPGKDEDEQQEGLAAAAQAEPPLPAEFDPGSADIVAEEDDYDED